MTLSTILIVLAILFLVVLAAAPFIYFRNKDKDQDGS